MDTPRICLPMEAWPELDRELWQRATKGERRLHQRADRVAAHILVCFLDFVLWKTLEMWQSRAGLGNSPRTVLEELARIQSHDVVLPTASHGQIRLRCVTQPDVAQAALLDRLGIRLPKRMRLADHELSAFAASA